MFYASQCYTRFQMFYSHCIGIAGSTMNWMALIQTSDFPADANVRWNAARFILAAQHLMFYQINETSATQPEPPIPASDPSIPAKDPMDKPLICCKITDALFLLS